jgi:hypothetical protein
MNLKPSMTLHTTTAESIQVFRVSALAVAVTVMTDCDQRVWVAVVGAATNCPSGGHSAPRRIACLL